MQLSHPLSLPLSLSSKAATTHLRQRLRVRHHLLRGVGHSLRCMRQAAADRFINSSGFRKRKKTGVRARQGRRNERQRATRACQSQCKSKGNNAHHCFALRSAAFVPMFVVRALLGGIARRELLLLLLAAANSRARELKGFNGFTKLSSTGGFCQFFCALQQHTHCTPDTRHQTQGQLQFAVCAIGCRPC